MECKFKNNFLYAGAGKAEIKFHDNFFPQEGFTEIYEKLYARVIILDYQEKFIMVSVEMTSLPTLEIEKLKELISDISLVKKDAIWICVTHSFSSPHFLPSFLLTSECEKNKINILRDTIHQAVIIALNVAENKMQKAQIRLGKGKCNINCNRDVETTEGMWIGCNPNGVSDKSLHVIKIDGESSVDEPIALLYHYNIQSSVMDGVILPNGSKPVTPDIVGKASSLLEEKWTNTVAMFLLGTAGDQTPVKKAIMNIVGQDGKISQIKNIMNGFQYIDELGYMLKESVIDATIHAEKLEIAPIHIGKKSFNCQGQSMPRNIQAIKPDSQYKYMKDSEKEVILEVMSIGDLTMLAMQPELNVITALSIRKQVTSLKNILIMTMVNGAAKYMADQESYKKRTYEAMNSFFAEGSAELLQTQAIEFLNEIASKLMLEDKVNDY